MLIYTNLNKNNFKKYFNLVLGIDGVNLSLLKSFGTVVAYSRLQGQTMAVAML